MEIKNTGGVSVTIIDIKVTDPDGDVHTPPEDWEGETLAVGKVTTVTVSEVTKAAEGDGETASVGTEVIVTVTTSEAGDLTYKAVVE